VLDFLSDLLFEPVVAFAAVLEAFEPATVAILALSFSHVLRQYCFSLPYLDDLVFGLRVLLWVQVLIAVSAPGSCRVTGAVYCCGYPLGGPSVFVILPGPQEPGLLAPQVLLDRIALCRAGPLVAIRGIGARGTRVAGRQAFQALPQVVS
jgi:hypothetical protein